MNLINIQCWKNNFSYFFLILVIILLIIVIYNYFSDLKNIVRHDLNEYIKTIVMFYNNNFIKFYIFVVITNTIYLLLMLPFFIIINSIIAVLVNNVIKSTIIILTSCVISSLICRLIVRNFIKKCVKERLKHNKVYKLINFEATNEPYKISMIMRFCAMPYSIKEYILSISNISQAVLINTSIINYLYCGIQSNIISKSLISYIDIINNNYSNGNEFIKKILLIILLIINYTCTIILCNIKSN